MACQRCGREQSFLSPCPSCNEYHLSTCEDERPLLIVDHHGSKVFSFKSDQEDLAREILMNLNSPASEWAGEKGVSEIFGDAA